MTCKVIQWATGGVGRAAEQCIAARPNLPLIAGRAAPGLSR